MRELSLFTGAGGGLLGTHLLGWTPVGYVEFSDYCQRVLAARIQDGHIPQAPIFGDIRAFIRDGYAASYTGMVDVVTAGFPCQPFSVAGKQAGADDPRNMWPATRDTIGIVRPRFAFLENVPGLLAQSHGYFGTILGDLATLGYDARWGVLGADDVGAPHHRKRLWVVAWSVSYQGAMASDADLYGHNRGQVKNRAGQARKEENQKRRRGVCPKVGRLGPCDADVSNAESKGPQGTRRSGREETTHPRLANTNWWQAEPELGRVADGVAHRVDRLKAIGNGQVPAVVRLAWETLSNV